MKPFWEATAMRSFLIITLAFIIQPAVAAEFQGKGFDAIAPLVGKTWVGDDVNAAGERTVSIERWEWILGGKAVRITASVNNGEVGYQLTFYIDPITHVLSFQGVGTDGPYLNGTVEIVEGKMIWKEKVIGTPYLDLVKLTFTKSSDDTMKSSSEYFKGDKSVPGGHEFHYRVVPDAKVVFAADHR
jgi:hypothetical protein